MTNEQRKIVNSVFNLIRLGYGTVLMVDDIFNYSIYIPEFKDKDITVEISIKVKGDEITGWQYSLSNNSNSSDISRLIPKEYEGLHKPDISNPKELLSLLSKVYYWFDKEGGVDV